MSKNNFIKGATILAAAGLIVKVLGALFRIPLMNIIGSEGVGLYQMAYPIYSFLLTISTSGIPIAISKIVAEKIALRDYKEAHKVFTQARKLMLIVGIATFLIFALLSEYTANFIGSERAYYSILAISPSLLFVSLICVYRGYFQGMQYMTPTATSQIIEQLGKLIFGLWFASIGVKYGPEYGAAGAIIGVTLAEAAALVLLLGVYRGKSKEIKININRTRSVHSPELGRSILSRLVRIAIPITIGSSIMPLVNVADTLIVVNRLTDIGYTVVDAEKLFGLLTGGANPLINFPTVLTIALSMSLVPAISEAYTMKDYRNISIVSQTGIRLTLLMGLPAAAGMATLAKPISALLYGNLPELEIYMTGSLLSILSIGVVFLTLIQTLTAILQGMGKVTIPVINLAIGAAFKVIVTYVSVGIPSINIAGAAYGTIICYGIAAILDFIYVIKYSKTSMSFKDIVIKPVIAVAVMSLAVYISFKYSVVSLGSNIATFFSIAVGVVVYVLILLVIGAVDKRDIELLPGGKRLVRLLNKLRLIKS